MEKTLIDIIKKQTEILLNNFETTIQTCDINYLLYSAPIWKHIYHTLHSCDQWFINPNQYSEPLCHEPNLNSLDSASDTYLSLENLQEYFIAIRHKVMKYLDEITDDMLYENPEGCVHSRLALILGQYRHMCVHMGNINATTIITHGKWPRVVGLDGDFALGLFE